MSGATAQKVEARAREIVDRAKEATKGHTSGTVALDLAPSRAWRGRMGEFRLMAAVLEDALRVLRTEPHGRLWWEARAWLGSRDRSWPLSFERICDALDLDPDRVRRHLSAEESEGWRNATDA
jgi:hypothetical protein